MGEDSNTPLYSKDGKEFNKNVIKKSYDLQNTFDGYKICSKKIQEFYLNNRFKGVNFIKIEDGSKEYFILDVHNILNVNRKKTKLTFENIYPIGDSVTFQGNLYLNYSMVTDGFYRTDISFGCGEMMQPLIIVPERVWLKMKSLKLKGVDYEQVFFEDDI